VVPPPPGEDEPPEARPPGADNSTPSTEPGSALPNAAPGEATTVATEVDSRYQGFGVVVLKLAFVVLMGLALCVAATGIIIAVALGFKGISGRAQH